MQRLHAATVTLSSCHRSDQPLALCCFLPCLLPGYDKRKYVWKLLYIYMMGYKIEFGHKQACDLIPKPK